MLPSSARVCCRRKKCLARRNSNKPQPFTTYVRWGTGCHHNALYEATQVSNSVMQEEKDTE
jgi:hypothetical protein